VFGRAVQGGGYDARYAAEGGLAAVNIGIAFRKVTGVLTYDDANTRALSLTQALPYRKSSQFDGMVDVDVDLRVS
jgi:ferric-dicitrate binding protein FerR (iron transport regulator)